MRERASQRARRPGTQRLWHLRKMRMPLPVLLGCRHSSPGGVCPACPASRSPTAPSSSPAAAAASGSRSRSARPSTAPTSCCWPRRPNRTPSCRAPCTPPSPRSRPRAARASQWSVTCARKRTSQRAVDTAVEHFGGVDIVHQQRQRHRDRTDRATRGQEVRPDDGHQHPRHVPADQGRVCRTCASRRTRTW